MERPVEIWHGNRTLASRGTEVEVGIKMEWLATLALSRLFSSGIVCLGERRASSDAGWSTDMIEILFHNFAHTHMVEFHVTD